MRINQTGRDAKVDCQMTLVPYISGYNGLRVYNLSNHSEDFMNCKSELVLLQDFYYAYA
jgi:hypothetical protein